MATVTITFSRPVGASAARGPFRQLRLEGEVMRAEPGGTPVAVHENHAWCLGGQTYTRADCDSPARLHFQGADESTSKTYGPFQSVSFVDGIAYADRAVFAFADRAVGDWYCHDDGHHYPVMLIQPAG